MILRRINTVIQDFESFLLDGLKRFSVEIWLDCKLKLQDIICFGSKLTSATEGRRSYWLIYDSQ